MGLSNAEKRPLPYRLRFPETVFGYSPNDGFSVVPLDNIFTDSTTRVKVELELSLDEYVALASAVDVGSDIAFNDDAQWIWWIWVRAIRGLAMDCDGVADCIETSEAVQNALNNYLIASGQVDPNSVDADSTTVNDRMTQAAQQSDVKDPPENCDLDILWAGCKEIVIRLDDNARSILENAIVINDIAQRYSDLIAAIPIIGSAASTLTKQFTEFIPDIYNSFNAYSSETVIEELTCSLFELVCNDCKYPTFEQVADTVSSNAFPLILNWETATLTVVLSQFIQTGSFTPSLVWHSMLLFQIITLYMGARWNGNTGTQAITFWALLGEDEPSDDWELLCDGCTQNEIEIEIGTTGCAGLNVAAGTVTKLSLNTYQIDSGHRAVPDEACYFRRVGGGDFVITSAVKLSGANIGNRGVCLNDTVVLIGGGGVPLNVCGDSFVVTTPNGQPFSYQITLGEC